MDFPINIELDKFKIAVIGGGKVAYRKCVTLLEFTENITVISNSFIDEFNYIKDRITIIEDNYREKYIKEVNLVIASTNNRNINYKIGVYCNDNNKLVNVVDNKEISNFNFCSYIKKGDLLIGVSTNGKSPSLSSKIKEELEEKYDGIEEYIEILGLIRTEVINNIKDTDEKKLILSSLIRLDLEGLKAEYKKYKKKN
ncbi:MAG: bifunctional precorrin-2 dehydrogenase/sirohydrochlorin ferrochelatase [Peptostreptococcaceae bacterium]